MPQGNYRIPVRLVVPHPFQQLAACSFRADCFMSRETE